MKIGDTLYRYNRENENRIGYDKKPAQVWFFHRIVGESATHWQVGFIEHPNKVNKKTMLEANRSGLPTKWFTERGKTEEEWRRRHCRHIIRMVEASSPDQLRRVAEVLKYDETTADA